ncbi:hypothetical protein T492DRAFT_1103311 [Pavlovales sp. CCMP2436]|nr:hypothetical protein T492DRAFT_1103311 [Pavlovales sp. CCMP2436]
MLTSTLASLLRWIVDAVLPRRPSVIDIHLTASSVEAQHDGAAEESTDALDGARVISSAWRAASRREAYGDQVTLYAEDGRAPWTETRPLDPMLPAPRIFFSWYVLPAGPGALRLGDTLASLHFINWDVGVVIMVRWADDTEVGLTRGTLSFDRQATADEKLRSRARYWHPGAGAIGAKSCTRDNVHVCATAQYIASVGPPGPARLYLLSLLNWLPLPMIDQSAWARRLITAMERCGDVCVKFGVPELSRATSQVIWSGTRPHPLSWIEIPLANKTNVRIIIRNKGAPDF